jgi:hypothetical protein
MFRIDDTMSNLASNFESYFILSKRSNNSLVKKCELAGKRNESFYHLGKYESYDEFLKSNMFSEVKNAIKRAEKAESENVELNARVKELEEGIKKSMEFEANDTVWMPDHISKNCTLYDFLDNLLNPSASGDNCQE